MSPHPWPELLAYIRLLREMAASQYMTVIRPWRFLDLLVHSVNEIEEMPNEIGITFAIEL